MVDPGAVNPLLRDATSDYLDFDNPSMSSDDTLALHSTPGPSPTPQPRPNGSSTLTEADPAPQVDHTHMDSSSEEDSDLEDGVRS